MALVVSTNSYLSTEDADLYFSERLYSETWDNANSTDKEKALIQATKRIDRQYIRGVKAKSSQTLQFPRSLYSYEGQIYDYGPGKKYVSNWVTESEVSQAVKDATCEEAIALLEGIPKRLKLQQQGIKSFSIGDLSESYKNVSASELLSVEARELLRPYLSGGAVIV